MTTGTIALVLALSGVLVLEWRRYRSIYWLVGAAVPIGLLLISLPERTVQWRFDLTSGDALLAAFVLALAAHAIGLLDRPFQRALGAVFGKDAQFNTELRAVVVPYAELIASYPENGTDETKDAWRAKVEREGPVVIAALNGLRAPTTDWQRIARGYAETYTLHLDDLRSGTQQHTAEVKALGDAVVAQHRRLQARGGRSD